MAGFGAKVLTCTWGVHNQQLRYFSAEGNRVLTPHEAEFKTLASKNPLEPGGKVINLEM